MAQSADQHTRIDDPDDAVRYLTEELGYSKGVAAYMMNQCYLDGQLELEKQECVRDGEPYGDWVAIDAEFGRLELCHGRMRFVPRIRLWREVRYRIAKHCDVRAIWSPTSQTAPDQQPKDKAGLDLVEADADDGLSAGQSPQESKADGWQARKVRQALKEKYPPDGDPPIEMTLTAILKTIDPIFEARKWKLASPDTLARVTGRRPA